MTRIVSLLIVASMLFGLGALGTAAGGNEDTSSVEPAPVPAEPPESRDSTGKAPLVEYDVGSDGAREPSIARVTGESDDEGDAGLAAEGDEDMNEIAPAAVLSIMRSSDAGPITIGDKVKVDLTVTVPASSTVHYPKVIDFLNEKAAHYVPGSATITKISGDPDTPATFTGGQEQPVRSNIPGGVKFVFRISEPIDNSSSATDYVFKVSYMYQYTGVRPNGVLTDWPATDSQSISGWSRLAWYEPPPPVPPFRDTNMSQDTKSQSIDIGQPLLQQTKTEPVAAPGSYYDGWWVRFNHKIKNRGWSDAHDITWEDYLPPELGNPMLLQVLDEDGNDITFDVTSDFSSSPTLTIDFGDESVAPGKQIFFTYVAWVQMPVVTGGISDVLLNGGFEIVNKADVDWSSLPGDVPGERVYDDQDWEEAEWKKDKARKRIWVSTTVPRLDITKVHDSGAPWEQVMVGDEVTYDISVTNSGPVTATIVPIVDGWDSRHLEFVSATTPPDSVSIGTWPAWDGALWNDLSGGSGLAPGETMGLSVTLKAIKSGTLIENRAFLEWMNLVGPTGASMTLASPDERLGQLLDVVGPGPIDSNVSIAEVDIVDESEISLVKSADPAAGTIMLPGQEISYAINYMNGAAELALAELDDEISTAADFVPGSISLTRNGATTPITDDPNDGDGGGYDPSLRTVFIDFNGMSADESGTLNFDVTVRDAEYSKQGVMNSATLSNGGFFSKESNKVYHPVDPFEIYKTGEDINGGRLLPGDDILWTITVINTGLVPTTNVVVYDTVPAYTTYVTDSITGTGADDSGDPDLVWNVGQMPVNGQEVLTFTSRVDANVPNGTQIRNQAAVESDQSYLTYSDSPGTAEVGDATLLQTGQNDWLWLMLALAAAGLGALITLKSRTWLKNAA